MPDYDVRGTVIRMSHLRGTFLHTACVTNDVDIDSQSPIGRDPLFLTLAVMIRPHIPRDEIFHKAAYRNVQRVCRKRFCFAERSRKRLGANRAFFFESLREAKTKKALGKAFAQRRVLRVAKSCLMSTGLGT